MSSKDNFGDRMKMYESHETGMKFMAGLPVYARLDGRGFSKFTKGMDRPFDKRMTETMKQVTADLVDRFGCVVGYTQSDEISLLFAPMDDPTKFMFGAKKQKLVSTLAAYTSARFTQLIAEHFPEKLSGNYVPTFDCRMFQLPSEVEAVNAILWREQDAIKNSVSMLAQFYFSHKQLQKKSRFDMLEMLSTIGVIWDHCPEAFKKGSYFKRVASFGEIPEDVYNKIPEGKRPESRIVKRTKVSEVLYPPLSKVRNRTDVIIRDADPLPIIEDK